MTIVSSSTAPMDPDDPDPKPNASPRPAAPPRIDLKQLLNDGEASAAPAPEPPKDSATPAPSAAPNAPAGEPSGAEEDTKRLIEKWDDVEEAPEFTPVEPGRYIAQLKATEVGKTSKDKDCAKLTWQIFDGDRPGRVLKQWIPMTDKSMGIAKRDLRKAGIASPAELGLPTSSSHRFKIIVGTRHDDEGSLWNTVRCVGRVEDVAPAANPFAPRPVSGQGGAV